MSVPDKIMAYEEQITKLEARIKELEDDRFGMLGTLRDLLSLDRACSCGVISQEKYEVVLATIVCEADDWCAP